MQKQNRNRSENTTDGCLGRVITENTFRCENMCCVNSGNVCSSNLNYAFENVSTAKALCAGSATQSCKNIATETVNCDNSRNIDPSMKLKNNEENYFLSAKHPLNIATWNVRTLFDDGKLETAIKEMNRYKLDIIGLCETRWTKHGEEKRDGASLIYSGKDSLHSHGVGLLMNKTSRRSLLTWEAISERIMTARFQGTHTKMTVIQVYAPINNATDACKEDFYNTLQAIVDKTPRHDLILLMGDFNAKISKDRNGQENAIGPFGSSKETNDNGERLILFCLQNQLKIMNTYFNHKTIHKKLGHLQMVKSRMK